MNRPHALRVRTRLGRTPAQPPAAVENVEAPAVAETPAPASAPTPLGGRRARGAERPARAKRTGYDDLSTEQVIAHISRLAPAELAVLAEYEREHQNRTEVLDRISVFRGHSTPEDGAE